MVQSIYILVVLFSLISCANSEKNKQNSNNSTCLDKWTIAILDNKYNISLNGNNIISKSVCDNCIKLMLIDSSNQSIITSYGEDIYLINCLEDTLYSYQIKNTSIPKQKSSLDTLNNKYIYSNNSEFYMFDRKLTLEYSSWNYLKTLSDSNRLGLSGVQINYEKNDNEIILLYHLLTDVEPIVKTTIRDTILIH